MAQYNNVLLKMMRYVTRLYAAVCGDADIDLCSVHLSVQSVENGSTRRLPQSVVDSLFNSMSLCFEPANLSVVCALFAAGKLQKRKFENCMPIDQRSWGYRRNAVYADYLTVSEIISELVETVRSHCISVIFNCFF